MKKFIVLFASLVFLTGCSAIDNSNLKVINGEKLHTIKTWNINYDTLSGYTNTRSFILNESTTTAYIDPKGIKQVTTSDWEIAEKRGIELSGNVKTGLLENNLVIKENGEGLIKIYRPLFFEDGRYILHVIINIFDSKGTKIAEFDIFNSSRAQNEKNGIRYFALGDIKDDKNFAIYCANKILEIINH